MPLPRLLLPFYTLGGCGVVMVMVLGIVVMQVVGAVLVIVTLLAFAMLTSAKFIVADVLGTRTGTGTESI